jgi:hypothetical protein
MLGPNHPGAKMPDAEDSLFVKFGQPNSSTAVTRDTVKSLASILSVSEADVVHIALAKLAAELFASYEPDDSPLTARQLAAIREDARRQLPGGLVRWELSLLPRPSSTHPR